jgi:serine/threonine-protein kinase
MASCPECRAQFGDDARTCPEHGLALVPDELVANADPPIPPGTMVGEYRIDGKLGAGTFGDVYAGEQPVIGKRVAVKVLNRRFASDPAVVSRFIAEARAVNRIRQRNIIDIFSFGVIPGIDRHYFVMELLEGLTLGAVLDRAGKLPVALALPLVQGIAAGLDAAHEAGITHRDLKPDNVFIVREREGTFFPKLLDFGIAKLVGQETAHKTGSGMVLGTPRYMSPEQARGRPTDHRADIYALGVMIHEMLTGGFLFDADSAVDMLLKHAVDEPPGMSSVERTIDPALDEPVLAMLSKRPQDRPASAGAAVAALAAAARRIGADRTSVTIAELVSEDRPTVRTGPQFSGTTAVASEAVHDPPPRAVLTPATPARPHPAEAGATLRTPADRGTGAPARGRTGPTTESVSTIEAPLEGRRQTRIRRAALVAMASIVALGAAALLGLGRGDGASRVVAVPSAMPPRPVATTATSADGPAVDRPDVGVAPAAFVSVMVWTRPGDVEIWQGDRMLGLSSAPLQLARGAAPVELRLKKDGFADATVSVTPDHDQGVDATLVPPPPARASASSPAASSAPPRALGPAQARPPRGGATRPIDDRILGGRD